MVAKGFGVGDLVWAKMKGYPPWPGEIINPPLNESSKVKKSHHYVYFYGSENHAWILDENIVLHEERLVKLYAQKKKNASFQKAVNKIIEKSKTGSRSPKEPFESFEEELNEVTSSPSDQKHKSSSEKKFTSKDASQKNSKRKKTEYKDSPQKRRTFSSNHNEAESSSKSGDHDDSNKGEFLDDALKQLFANIPPNIGYNGDSVPPPSGLLLRKNYIERPETPPLDLSRENTALKEKHITPTAKKIGFLGLGKMGQGIVKNLLQSGHKVTIWTRNTEKYDPFLKIGAREASTPSDVVKESDITFCCVADTHAAKALVFGNCGILQGLENGSEKEKKGYVEMTSMDPRTSYAISQEVIQKGGRYLEAPLSGSRPEANEGNLLILGAGDQSLFEECKSCFQAIARETLFVSPTVGDASKFNIIHSMLLGTVYAALAESLSLVRRNKLDEVEFLKVLKYGALDNKIIFEKGMAMVKNDYASNIPLKHVQKDLNMGLKLSETCVQPLPIFSITNEAYKHLKLLRYADHDVSAIYEGTRQ